MTKILLVKMAEERRTQYEHQNRFSDQYLSAFAAANNVSYAVAMERLFNEVKAQYPNIYNVDERLRLTDSTVIKEIVSRLEDFSFIGTGDDIKGAVYEIFLKSTIRFLGVI